MLRPIPVEDVREPAPMIPHRKIVLIEDDAGVRRSMQLLLEGQGYDVRSYADADPLLRDGSDVDAKCLVCDFRLTERDGIEVLVELRQSGWQGPAVLVTAFGTPDVIRRAYEAGFAKVLEKPLKAHLLIDTIARIVGGKPSSDDAWS